MKIGDLIKLSPGIIDVLRLQNTWGLLLKKLPRSDDLEYDWQVLASGKIVELGRQIEGSLEVVN